MPRWGLGVLVVLAVLLVSCGGSGGAGNTTSLPDGAELLADSATAMRTVTSARIDLDIEGQLPAGIPLQSAEGQLTQDGSARGTAALDMGQQILQVEFVIIGEDLYLRGPTGGFRKLAAASVFSAYNPTVILNPDRGVAAVLASGTAATTEDREQVDGVDSYRLEATFPGDILGTFMPGTNQETTGQVWIATDGLRLVQARFPTSDNTTITLRLSDYNALADITAPI
ncbi:MAG: LppX_LprAFG lipoprotein [Pseudonocardiaceae bacterium]